MKNMKDFNSEIDFNSRFDHKNANYRRNFKKDLNRLENRLMIFCNLDNKFYKLAYLDQRSLRFDAWGERMTRFITFGQGVLFDYKDEALFDSLYQQYVDNFKPERTCPVPRTKEYLISWFELYEGRIDFLPEHPERKIDYDENDPQQI